MEIKLESDPTTDMKILIVRYDAYFDFPNVTLGQWEHFLDQIKTHIKTLKTKGENNGIGS